MRPTPRLDLVPQRPHLETRRRDRQRRMRVRHRPTRVGAFAREEGTFGRGDDDGD